MAFVIPSIFSAVDRLSGPARAMGRAIGGIATSAQSAAAKANKALSSINAKASSIAGTAATGAAALLAPIALVTKKAADYEKGLNSFRTIVSDLTDKEFSNFEKKIFDVANASGKSATTVVTSFEKIAGLNADFAKTADGLGAIAQAAITLSRASGEELEPSTESLVGIMNQFGFAADQANRTINVLAAGQAAGAASIGQTSEALGVFGAVAKSSNATLEQSVALIETLAAKQIQGAEAGTALRGAFVRLQKAGLGYKTGQFQITEALEDANKKVQALSTAKAKDAYVTNLFGLENLTAGKILLDSTGKIQDFTKAVTGSSEAQKAAEINGKGLSERIAQLRDRMETVAVKVGSTLLPILEKLADKIVPIITRITEWIDKNPVLVQRIVLATAAVGLLLLATSALAAAVAAVTSPIGIAVAAIAALAAVGYIAYKKSESFRKGLDSLWSSVKDLFSTLWDLVKLVLPLVIGLFSAQAQLLMRLLAPALRIVVGLIRILAHVLEGIGNFMERHPWLKSFAEGILMIATGPIRLLIAGLEKIADLVDKVFPTIQKSEIGRFNPAAPNAAAQFAGVRYTPGGWNMASGQFAPSLVTPSAPVAELPAASDDIMKQLTELMGGMNGSVDVNVSAAPGSNANVTGSSGIAKPQTKPTVAPW